MALISSNPQPYIFQEYPKWVGTVLVNNKEEEDALGISDLVDDEPPAEEESDAVVAKAATKKKK